MKTEQNCLYAAVQMVEITEETSDQRLDNFLITKLKGVPKSHIYRIVRKGEVRVNKGRVDVKYRLQSGDLVRIPPVRVNVVDDIIFVPKNLKQSLEQDILFEDDVLMVLNKPAGYAVHGGSGLNTAVIESLRQLRPDAHFLELVHRLDRDTSGCLIIAKKRSALRTLHELFRGDGIKKSYLALLSGVWEKKSMTVNAPLLKQTGQSGERMVIVSQEGKSSATFFKAIKSLPDATWVEASPQTGRTHQIRVHAAWLGHPIIGDDRYGDFEVNRGFKKRGIKRLFLHAFRLEFQHPVSGKPLTITAPIPADMQVWFDDKK
ncbi:23S rRNA pseudouridine(955/2504/2580) synthase RluC [Methylicorpusculum sp.]|uniref:23S rRNA pseudouridine(955/2504/2580) synthase RluC n=2 Tax=Methylicorpusculum sp. TaxID=2713644 RepID=UPI00271767AD|nr:23S rRNA pseudouridine(955/2504/2580) synthase RluC [Methylicorpusculum sp.]MDO8846404.1 23S rRNA pseudouridine(955/2504/2580) synthase RluC [Methylicorpusculum sp.]MDP2180172.1 23S rRNA pseudouridine(955/2504/2580) synthase RluC [Methylicorpusculum sp.]MDP3530727.1 23S rRNA pseudouridine(955/2504/2580) synthase RluC [Methylicorpusculum sp.]